MISDMSSERWLSVKGKITQLISRLSDLEEENDQLQSDLQSCKAELNKQREESQQGSIQEMDLLKTQLARKDAFIQQLEDELLARHQKTKDLEEQLAVQDNTLQIQKNTILDLSEQNKLIKLAKGMSSDKTESHELKIKINQLIRDIDRCIDLLND